MSAANVVSALTTTSEPPGSGPVGAGVSGTPRSPPSSTGPEERSTTRSACGSRVRVRRRIPRPCWPLPCSVKRVRTGCSSGSSGTRRASHPGRRSDRASGIGAPLAAVTESLMDAARRPGDRWAAWRRGRGCRPETRPVHDRVTASCSPRDRRRQSMHVDTKRAATQHVRVGMSSRAASPAGLPDVFCRPRSARSRRCVPAAERGPRTPGWRSSWSAPRASS